MKFFCEECGHEAHGKRAVTAGRCKKCDANVLPERDLPPKGDPPKKAKKAK